MPQIMRSAPDEQKIKCLTDDLLVRGDRVALANVYGVTEQAVSQKFNRNGEARSHIYLGLYDLWAIAGVNEDAGRVLRTYIDGLFESWLGPVAQRDSNELIGNMSQEFTNLLKAKLGNFPAHVQLKEALELQQILKHFIESLEPGNVAQMKSVKAQ